MKHVKYLQYQGRDLYSRTPIPRTELVTQDMYVYEKKTRT